MSKTRAPSNKNRNKRSDAVKSLTPEDTSSQQPGDDLAQAGPMVTFHQSYDTLFKAGVQRRVISANSAVSWQAIGIIVGLVLAILLAQPAFKPNLSSIFTTPEGLTVIFFAVIAVVAETFAIVGTCQLNKLNPALNNLTIIHQQFDELAKRLRLSSEDLDDTKALLRSSIERVTALAKSLTILKGYATPNGVPRDLETAIGALLFSLVKDRKDVLAFIHPNDYYNVAVYGCSSDADELVQLYRSCDDRIDRKDRSWAPGKGHVGYCFANNEPVITPDTAETQQFLSDDPDRDLQYYRSIAAFPIKGSELDKEGNELPIGVLVWTSSIPRHFGDEYTTLGEAFADLLSVCMQLHNGCYSNDRRFGFWNRRKRQRS